MRTPAELLRELGELGAGGEPVPLTRLAKRLDTRVSGLLREFAALTEATLGGVPGPAWVELACDDAGRWTVGLTARGRQALQQS